MNCLVHLFVFIRVFLVPYSSSGIPVDSVVQARFQKLAEKMRLKSLKRAEGDYEIRIWKKCELCYGDAHELYLLHRKTERLFVVKYRIDSNKRGYKRSKKIKPTRPVPPDLWAHLMQQDILTLPDESSITSQLHPRQEKSSTWTSLEPDGSVSVHAKKVERSVWISDGESYYVEVFGAGRYRAYGYSNPEAYLKYKPTISELRKVVAILDEIAAVFYSLN